MKKVFIIFFTMIWFLNLLPAQHFDVDTLNYHGSADRLINLVIMGDGYTALEQKKFLTDADQFIDYLFGQIPFQNYKNYFNIYAIKVISAESGTKHPNTASDCSNASPLVPVSNPDTYFGCTFDVQGIHRLMYPTNIQNVYSVLAASFPNSDQVIIIANNPYYGGGGGQFAATTTHPYAAEVITHEMGHSFAGLEDEYESGIDFEAPNQTGISDPDSVRWKNWVGLNDINVYQKGSTPWYRPHQNCKMRFLNRAFCSVCTEAIIERIHTLTDPVLAFSPAESVIDATDSLLHFSLDLIKPDPNTLSTQWSLDDSLILRNVDTAQISGQLSPGQHTLSVMVTDSSSLIRVANHSQLIRHFNLVSWTVNKTTNKIRLSVESEKMTCKIYPNPVSDVLNIGIESDNPHVIIAYITTIDGKIVAPAIKILSGETNSATQVNITSLKPGVYKLICNFDGHTFAEQFIKI